MQPQKKPKWRAVYARLTLMVALLFAQQPLPLTSGCRQVVLILILMLTYTPLLRWVWINDAGLQQEHKERAREAARAAAERAEQARERQTQAATATPVQRHFREVLNQHTHSEAKL